ncbi:MAG: thermonuclease family protein [Kiloniellaceae bacterium]
MTRHVSVLALGLLLPWAVLADFAGTASVIDGDTLEIHGQRIRLHGIDAPESRQMCLAEGVRWRCGQKGALRLAEKIGRSTVTCEKRDTDRYGRTVAICYVRGEDLNHWMVINGWALAYQRYSKKYVDEERAAQASRLGLWRGQFVPPWEWRRGKWLGTSTVTPPEKSAGPRISQSPGQRICCKICRKGKACGNSCISRLKTCHKPPGCACNAY